MAYFRTRARTVDMLGRQQIAGIPTAVSELFKNAYDAYAKRVEVDFYRSDGLFVLRDDGIGMTRADFEARWLTLGTDSKVKSGGLEMPPVPSNEAKRPVLGEKGIGRLAVAAIGDLTLVLTRSRYPKERDEIVCALLHWGIFALPGLDLEDIEVPIVAFAPDHLPDAAEVRDLAKPYIALLEDLRTRTDSDLVDQIITDLRAIDIDPNLVDDVLMSPSLRGQGASGTHFFVKPADESLYATLDRGRNAADTSNLVRLLIGFANTMIPEHPEVPIKTAFRDHRTDDSFDDIIGEHEFFTPNEFLNADHQIQGVFDDFGQFCGDVTVYGERHEGHVVSFDAHGERTACGSFKVSIAVVQGEEDHTTLPSVDFQAMKQKLDRLGGIYIYNDGIRVLPYGDSRTDFIDIERRRTQNAAHYYFSYRRMFGVIEIDRDHNSALKEKAGREGFRDNKAFRQFRDILINFFVQLAADFFRVGGTKAERWVSYRSELKRASDALKEREKRFDERRKAFRAQLGDTLAAIDRGEPTKQVDDILASLREELRSVSNMPDRIRAENAILTAEERARTNVRQVRDHFRVSPPRGIGMPKTVRRDYEAYSDAYQRLSDELFEPAVIEIENELSRLETGNDAGIRRRQRFYAALEDAAIAARRTLNQETKSVRDASHDLQERVEGLMRQALSSIDALAREVISAAERIDVIALADAEFVKRRVDFEQRIELDVEKRINVLSAVAAQLHSVRWDTSIDGEVITETDVAAALDDRLIALQERADAD